MSQIRLSSLAFGLIGATASFVACSGSVTTTDTTGSGGDGGEATTTSTTSTTTTTTTTSTSSVGGGGTGGVANGGAGGVAVGGSGGAPDPWAGPIESLAELDLGDIVYGTQTAFPIPDKTLGFTLQVEGQQATSVVGVYRLRPPVGGSVILNFAMAGHDTQVFGGQRFIGAADPQSDSTDAFPVKAGQWKVTTGSDGNSGDTAHVSAWVRRTADGAFHGGVIDINVLSVPGVASASYMSQVLNAFFPYAGLDKGNPDAYTLDASYSTIGTQDEYRALLASSAGIAKAPAINLFVVDNFSDSAFGGAIGVAGGIPGSPMRHGTTQSGVAFEPSGDPSYDATVLMHEIGHLAGLFHTTEFQIAETDPLSDTSECAAATIANNPDQCGDKSNVMFPIAYGATTFSPAQLNVLHGSALYRGILEAGGVPSPPLSLVAPPDASQPAPFLDDGSIATGVRSMPHTPDALERALGALWCSGGLTTAALGVARNSTLQLSRTTAKTASARLRAIAVDDTLPILLRKRALRLYVEAAKADGVEAEATEMLLGIAGRKAAGSIAERRLQTEALRLLTSVRVSARASIVSRIDQVVARALASGDRLLAAVAAGK